MSDEDRGLAFWRQSPGAFTFILPASEGEPGKEAFRIEPDGSCYCRGELVEKNAEVWAAFRNWLEATGVNGGPDVEARLDAMASELANREETIRQLQARIAELEGK